MRAGAHFAGAAITALLSLACNENLTAPADCPTLCPGQATTFDTVLTPLPGVDSSFAGYVARGAASSLLVSNGLPAGDARAVVRWAPRADTVVVGGSGVGYTIDSVVISLVVVARDTSVDGLVVSMHRLPATVDDPVTFAEVEAALTPANLLTIQPVADSVPVDTVEAVFRGSDLDRVVIPTGSGQGLAIGVSIQAPGATGVRIGSATAGAQAPRFLTYVTAMTPDAARPPPLVPTIAFNTFVLRDPTTAGPDLLTVGGAPASRALIRFALPPRIRDSATIIRATLELIPATPILGLPGDTAVMEVRGVLSDLGAKSPVERIASIPPGFTIVFPPPPDTVRVEITRTVQLWQTPVGRPASLFAALVPIDEGMNFTTPVFGSTRSAAGQPRLRITYSLPFPFENP